MKPQKKRVRIFAGPNGSGKSTVKNEISPNLIGMYVNPDDIERSIHEHGFLDLKDYEINTSSSEILSFFTDSSFLRSVGLVAEAEKLRFSEGKLWLHKAAMNAYFASVLSDFIRRKLLDTGKSFSFETVMSSADKVEFLQTAQAMGYRTYLYFVATEDPKVNLVRVQQRVEKGGHGVPEDKVIARYHRSLALLPEAIRCANRAYLLDNTVKLRLILEVTGGKEVEMQTSDVPEWCRKALHETFAAAGS